MKKDFDYNADLKKRLPELKEIEGFPIGEDEDILALSDPPYYTACPNPYINEFIEKYGNPYDEKTNDYHREPFVGDVSEGKNHPIYLAHGYPTKVPHKAIEQYIKHYTEEGDIVFDGFCGSGMTGVAAQFLKRKVVLSDLSPLATFISNNYNNPVELFDFVETVKSAISSAYSEIGWLYSTKHNESTSGIILSTIWSDKLICPFCNKEYVFFETATLDGELKKKYNCPNCSAKISKKVSSHLVKEIIDIDNERLKQKNQVPVLIDYKVGNKRYLKKLDSFDLNLIEKINNYPYSEWFPTDKMLFKGSQWGDLYRAGYHFGISKIHHFYTKRSLIVLSYLKKKLSENASFFFTSLLINSSKMSRYGKRTGNVSGTLYMPTLIKELNILEYSKRKLSGAKGFIKPMQELQKNKQEKSIVTTQSSTNLNQISSNSIDYIFVDPPFGDNLPYSELSFIQEGWLKVFTNNKKEAIISTNQVKRNNEYEELIYNIYKEYYRVLKPNRWITTEFHNSKSSVWNSIQNSIIKAGFIIAQVSTLDKVQGSFKQVTAIGAVKNDLVISAYKPSKKFEEKFLKNAGEGLELDFIKEFLYQQPIRPITERTEKMLYSKMLSYYIQHGYEVRYDAKIFYQLLRDNFADEDGYWFNAGQINSYIEYKKKMKLEGIDEIKQGAMMMFVTDEKSALVWLHNFLNEPKSFSDIHTAFTQLANIQGDEVPDLKDLLEQNFIAENGLYRRPQTEPEHNSVIEKREKQLMRQFESLLIQAQTEKKKIKSIRKEAVQLGFETCYKEKRFQDILTLANRLDKKILEENAELKEFVDAAEIMISGLS